MTKKNQYNLLLLKLLLFMIFTNKRNHCFNITGYLNQSELIYDLNLNQSEPIINDLKFNQILLLLGILKHSKIVSP